MMDDRNCFEERTNRSSGFAAGEEGRLGRGFWKGFFTAILMIGIAVGAFWYFNRPIVIPGRSTSGEGLDTEEAEAILTKADQFIRYIDEYYILEDIPKESLIEGIYRGIMGTLSDRYAAYYTAEEFEEIKKNSQGSFGGMGISVTPDREIVSVYEDSPASEAGIQPGDIIIAADGTDITGMAQDEYMTLLRGEVGDVRNLTLLRPSTGETYEVTMTLRIVNQKTIVWKWLDNGIAYLQITNFHVITIEQFDAALEEIQSAEDFAGLILDLRNNPGGELDTVVHIADKLMPSGLIAYTLEKTGEREDFTSKGEGLPGIPMAVLINGDSASASELLAGALKDRGIATVVGTQSFGKGIVQTTWWLGDGSAFKMTTAKYYTPSGEEIQGVGITPDVVVEMPEDVEEGTDPQLDAAYDVILDDLGIAADDAA